MNNNHLIIMAGGVGSRFWPMSTPEVPKQFIDVLGVGKSLLQLTVERFSGVIPADHVWVVTSKDYKELVKAQVPGIRDEQVLLEPCRRNTAPCIAYVTCKIKKKYPGANLVFSPADHLVLDTGKFREVITRGLEFTASSNAIVTLGMEPDRPETGYGYIKGEGNRNVAIRKVQAFKEKPELAVAKRSLADGGYYWNSGIFLWNENTVISEFEQHAPDLAAKFSGLSDVYFTCREQEVIDREFFDCRNISIDYAIMEKSANTYVYPASFGWSDLGTWGSLYTLLDKDREGNAVIGNAVKLVDCKNCVVHTPGERKVVVQGLEGYIVAEHGDTLLVCKKEMEQQIKEWQI